MSFPGSHSIAITIVLMAVSLTTGALGDPQDWMCKNGQMIYLDEVCDGAVDCFDGSDETTDECMSLSCPMFAFRCAYGACVIGNAKCNGVKDCADNSDEALCPRTIKRRRMNAPTIARGVL